MPHLRGSTETGHCGLVGVFPLHLSNVAYKHIFDAKCHSSFVRPVNILWLLLCTQAKKVKQSPMVMQLNDR